VTSPYISKVLNFEKTKKPVNVIRITELYHTAVEKFGNTDHRTWEEEGEEEGRRKRSRGRRGRRGRRRKEEGGGGRGRKEEEEEEEGGDIRITELYNTAVEKFGNTDHRMWEEGEEKRRREGGKGKEEGKEGKDGKEEEGGGRGRKEVISK
jgi:hypothetical protein